MRGGIVPIELPATTMPVAKARQRRNHCEGSDTCAATDQVNLTQNERIQGPIKYALSAGRQAHPRSLASLPKQSRDQVHLHTRRSQITHHGQEELPDFGAERGGEHARDPDDRTGCKERLRAGTRSVSSITTMQCTTHGRARTLYPLSDLQHGCGGSGLGIADVLTVSQLSCDDATQCHELSEIFSARTFGLRDVKGSLADLPDMTCCLGWSTPSPRCVGTCAP